MSHVEHVAGVWIRNHREAWLEQLPLFADTALTGTTSTHAGPNHQQTIRSSYTQD